MTDKEFLLKLAKQAKEDGKQHLVQMYCDNYKRLVLKAKRKAIAVAAANAQ